SLTVSRCKAATSRGTFSSIGFSNSWPVCRSTRVDTEPRFSGKLKAICDGFPLFFRVRVRRSQAGVTQPTQAHGQDGSHALEAVFGGQVMEGVVGRSHGTSPLGAAHSGLRYATGALSGGVRSASTRLSTRNAEEVTGNVHPWVRCSRVSPGVRAGRWCQLV